ncbi:MAG TPA: SpoIIE family protein phosphatase, partial [Candidatus Polarisedimenticolia bacterium]|nr:SpoIIE family protein phosphatase [Candidatus Polarisedimenticolia bacterium]
MSRLQARAAAATDSTGPGWSRLDEMISARRVQARLLPDRTPRRGGLECAGTCLQDRGVGGDFWDVLEPSPDRTVLVVGDVSGKGMPAALMMSALQAMLRTGYALGPDSLGRRLETVNRLFTASTACEHYATLFVGEHDAATGRLVYANCGHVAPLVLRRGLRVDRLRPTATVLGLFDRFEGATAATTLEEGDLLLGVSDGVTEAEDAAGATFGETRLVAA